MAQMPKNMPTLFHEPKVVEVRSVKIPKERIFTPKIILINKNKETKMEETRKAKCE